MHDRGQGMADGAAHHGKAPHGPIGPVVLRWARCQEFAHSCHSFTFFSCCFHVSANFVSPVSVFTVTK